MKQLDIKLLLLLALISLDSDAQKTKEAFGVFKLRIEKNVTEEFAINKAIEKAKINAIENAFGTVINQGNAVYVKDITTGKQTESNMVFTSIADVLVNGEWIATLDEKRDFYDEDGYRWVKINIKGKVRELTKIPFTPEAYTLSCHNKKCSTEVFNNGQELVVYFKAPNNGYVTIYLDDTKQVQRLLPYSNYNTSNTYEVKADQEYYFFSNTDKKEKNVDNIELFTSTAMEQNKLQVLFSKDDFGKPVLTKSNNEEVNGMQYAMPMSTTVESFQSWLQKIRSYNRNIELQTILITIKK
ncbi:MAG: hypothetical protein NTU43_12785 [Bacteroidetes bacterium]|nr:hypothetical protein [Bacteroidota bacterium]